MTSLSGKSSDYFRAAFIPSMPFPGIFVSRESLRWQRRALARIKANLRGPGSAAISSCVTRDLLRRKRLRGWG